MHRERRKRLAHDEPENIEGRVHIASNRVATVRMRAVKQP
jgi:hypothetical protein